MKSADNFLGRLIITAWAVATPAAWGCDAARTGTFHGDLPPPVAVQSVSGLPTNGGDAQLDMQMWDYQPPGQWAAVASPSQSFWGVHGDSETSAKVYLWEDLAGHLVDHSGPSPTFAVIASISGVVDYLFVVSSQDISVQPVGASGPQVSLKSGFQILHRTCSADEPVGFEQVPLDTVVTYDASAAAAVRAGRDPYVEACGIPVSAADVGNVAAALPADLYGVYGGWGTPITELAWAPSSDAVYMLAGTLEQQSVELLRVKVGESGATQMMFGGLYGPLEVATGGTSLLFNQANVESTSISSTWRIRAALLDGQVLSQARIPNLFPPQPGSWNSDERLDLLSPDGTTLAIENGDQTRGPRVQLIDVGKATVSVEDLASGYPLAWDPSGKSLLIGTPSGTFATLALDGTLNPIGDNQQMSNLPLDTPVAQYFWTASGPQALGQGAHGVIVYNIVAQASTQLVEANRVAPPSTPLGVVVATEQVFAWAAQCFGIGGTSCNAELRRLSIATGKIDVVAHASSALPFAVSPNGTTIAFADRTNIYLKSIQP
jgi:hypothetical protein